MNTRLDTASMLSFPNTDTFVTPDRPRMLGATLRVNHQSTTNVLDFFGETAAAR